MGVFFNEATGARAGCFGSLLFLYTVNLEIPPGGYYTNAHMSHGNNKARLIRRLKLIEGQVRGLQRMLDEDAYCIDVITQTSAVKQGLSNIEDILLEDHLAHCVVNQIKSGKVKKAQEEILKVYQLKRK